MPPTAATTTIRKAPATSNPITQTHDANTMQRRTTSGRAVRQSTTRPSNYYVKPYSSLGAAAAHQSGPNITAAAPPGFFPALTYFTDAITALPKEVMRQFTAMKEVEAKVHAPHERLGEMVDAAMEFPVPRRRDVEGAEGDGPGPGPASAGMGVFNLAAGNSVTGSTAASLVNGINPNAAVLGLDGSVAGSVVDGGGGGGEDVVMDEEMGKRQQFHELRVLMDGINRNLDEKNVVLAEANRILSQQHRRLDSVLPHVDTEISEEARLGSVTHWAYSDNRQKKPPAGTAANRRDVAATNSLAAAASAIHESDIAQARREATRENAREKHKGRAKEAVDSDFDDKPKKTHAKVAKSKATAAAAGLGISANGEPVKKRKIDKEKNLAAPGMERGASSKGAKATANAKETPRSTPHAEMRKKEKAKSKPAPLAPPAATKRKGVAGASPALGASSPLHSSFGHKDVEAARPQSARLRQGSNATNLRHEKAAADERPTSAPVKAHGEKKRKAHSDPDEEPRERKHSLKREVDDPERLAASRSHSHSGKAGRGSATGTPQQESFGDDVPAMRRARSIRSVRREDSSSEPQAQGPRMHQRQVSNSHLVRQLAPFNRSPNLDRHLDDDLESLDGERRPDMSPPKRRLGSRRNTIAASPPPGAEGGDAEMRDAAQGEMEVLTATQDSAPTAASSPPASPTAPSPSPMPSPAHSPPAEEDDDVPEPASPDAPSDVASEAPAEEASELADMEDYDGSSLGDPDDPNEVKYCYCDRGSYGEMIACDNPGCPREWFHIGCVGLKEPPDEEEKWFCRDCAPLFSHERERPRGRGRGRGGRGRG